MMFGQQQLPQQQQQQRQRPEHQMPIQAPTGGQYPNEYGGIPPIPNAWQMAPQQQLGPPGHISYMPALMPRPEQQGAYARDYQIRHLQPGPNPNMLPVGSVTPPEQNRRLANTGWVQPAPNNPPADLDLQQRLIWVEQRLDDMEGRNRLQQSATRQQVNAANYAVSATIGDSADAREGIPDTAKGVIGSTAQLHKWDVVLKGNASTTLGTKAWKMIRDLKPEFRGKPRKDFSNEDFEIFFVQKFLKFRRDIADDPSCASSGERVRWWINERDLKKTDKEGGDKIRKDWILDNTKSCNGSTFKEVNEECAIMDILQCAQKSRSGRPSKKRKNNDPTGRDGNGREQGGGGGPSMDGGDGAGEGGTHGGDSPENGTLYGNTAHDWRGGAGGSGETQEDADWSSDDDATRSSDDSDSSWSDSVYEGIDPKNPMIEDQLGQPNDPTPLRTQEEVIVRFVPILKSENQVYRKTIPSFIRKASEGEHIVTIIDGVKATEKKVEDDNYWLVCGQVAGEFYPISDEKFKMIYDTEQPKLLSHINERLHNEGFKAYCSKRQIYAHKVDEGDMSFFHQGMAAATKEAHFVAPWGTPIRVELGDYLVLQYPDGKDDIYRIECNVFEGSYTNIHQLADLQPNTDELKPSEVTVEDKPSEGESKVCLPGGRDNRRPMGARDGRGLSWVLSLMPDLVL